MAAEYDEYEEEEAPAPKKPKRARKPIDWPLTIMLVGSLVFLLVFGLITLMAPRRPFLMLRVGQSARPGPTVTVPAVVSPVVAVTPAPKS